ncbi:MAG: cysteine desulfurase [Ruminococcaceae bacterium]|nr:cysteine desulfurase [Oscillospiraceae bacterium]
MKKEIYLDNSATTALSLAARDKINEVCEIYGNPSSLHSMGQNAEKIVREARERILNALGVRAREGELVFTSCGTEASALAILGSAYAKERRDAIRILTSDSEHPSVLKNIEVLQKEGFEVVKIPTFKGVLDISAIESALDKKVFLASFMLVNNETGAIYNVSEAFAKIKAKYPEAITHCDAVQGFMKIPFTPTSIKADLITVSGHKLHAPKGVGALYISADMIKKKKIIPYLLGGGQENGMRSGTENTIGIAAFGASVYDIKSRFAQNRAHFDELYSYASEKIDALDIKINRPSGDYAHHIINVSLPNIKSETVLHFLSSDGVFVSSGSACSSHSKTPSGTLIAFGLTPAEADSSLRISFSEYNTKEDIDVLCESLKSALERLVRIKR